MFKCIKCQTSKEPSDFEKSKALKRGHRATCKPCYAEAKATSHRKWREKNSASLAQKKAEYWASNREEILERNKKWRLTNPEKKKSSDAKCWRARREKVYLQNAVRHKRHRQATPPWADKAEIKLIYKQARSLGKLLKMKIEVDHIVPLNGELVSGLHIPENLQIVTQQYNRVKANNYSSI